VEIQAGNSIFSKLPTKAQMKNGLKTKTRTGLITIPT
jgi:hypothetical protein